jgi:hypothetical protein
MASGIVLGVTVWLTLSALASKSPNVVAELQTARPNDGTATVADAPPTTPLAATTRPQPTQAEAAKPRRAVNPAASSESSPAQEKPNDEKPHDASKEAKPNEIVPEKPAETTAAATASTSSKPEAAPPAAAGAAEPPAENKPASMPSKAEPDDSKTSSAVAEATPGEPAAGPAARDPLADPAAGDTSSTALAQIEMHLDDKFVKIDFQEKSLSEFLDVLSEFSTIPIGLDREALAKVGKGPETPVTVRMTDVTVAQALEAALARHGLVTLVRGGKLVVTTGPVTKGPAKP